MNKQRTEEYVADIMMRMQARDSARNHYIDPSYVYRVINSIAARSQDHSARFACLIWDKPGTLDALHKLSHDRNVVDVGIKELIEHCFVALIAFEESHNFDLLIQPARKVLLRTREVQQEIWNIFPTVCLTAIMIVAIDAKEHATNAKLKRFISSLKLIPYGNTSGESGKCIAIDALQKIGASQAQIDDLRAWENVGETDFNGFQESDFPTTKQ
jgi:hypothetical protein